MQSDMLQLLLVLVLGTTISSTSGEIDQPQAWTGNQPHPLYRYLILDVYVTTY